MVLAMAVVFPSFEIATPRMITMMLTTSMISNSVKPCCLNFVLISMGPPSRCADYSSVVFKKCYQHLIWIETEATLQCFGSFYVTALLPHKFNGRCAEG